MTQKNKMNQALAMQETLITVFSLFIFDNRKNTHYL